MIDLWLLLRRLVAWPTLVLAAVGAIAGVAVRHHAGTSFHAEASWALPPLACPTRAGTPQLEVYDAFALPSVEGASLQCHFDDARLTCASTGSSQLAADSALYSFGALVPSHEAFARMRFVRSCLAEYPAADPEYLARRQEASAGTARIDGPRQRESHPRLPRALILGLVAGLGAAALVAGRRARTTASFTPAIEGTGALLALMGMLLTCSMSRALAVEVGPFTVRFAQLCALVFFALALRERVKKAPIAFPSAPALAAVAYLSVAAASAMFSENPTKSLGYLGWAGFDLVVAFGGLVLWVCTPERLRIANRVWLAGTTASVLFGGVQLGAWWLGYPPPLGYTDNLAHLPRLNGFSSEPSYYVLYIVPGALLLLTRAAHQGRKGLGSLALAVMFAIAIALSTSRSGWLALAIGVALLAALLVYQGGKRPLLWLGGASAGGAVTLAIVLAGSPALRGHVARFARMGVDATERSSSAPRLVAAAEAGRMAARHPLLGVGFGGYGASALNHPTAFKQVDRDAHSVVTANLYLELLAETGGLGLLAALALLATLLAPSARRLRRSSAHGALAQDREGLLLASVVVLAVLFQFNQTLWRLDIWILLALSFAAGALPDDSPGPLAGAAPTRPTSA